MTVTTGPIAVLYTQAAVVSVHCSEERRDLESKKPPLRQPGAQHHRNPKIVL